MSDKAEFARGEWTAVVREATARWPPMKERDPLGPWLEAYMPGLDHVRRSEHIARERAASGGRR